jgi:hypothetical protein
MPKVMDYRGHRFSFFSQDCAEPPHIHVTKANSAAKFWLQPITLQDAWGYNRSDLNELQQVLSENLDLILEKWDEHCGTAH